MKLHTTAAAALLVSTLVVGGCGEQEDPKAESIGYGNYLPRVERQDPMASSIDYSNYLDAAEREALKRAETPTVGYGNYVPKSERSPSQAPSGYDRHQSVDGGFGFPYGTDQSGPGRASDHSTHDRVRALE